MDSYMQNLLNNAKNKCTDYQDCSEYENIIADRLREIDYFASLQIRIAITTGIIIILIGLITALTPRIKILLNLEKFLVPKIITILPILIALIGGAIIGFIVAFDACYLDTCNGFQNSATITMPILGLILGIPISIKFFKKRKAIKQKIDSIRPSTWTKVGIVIVIFGVLFAITGVYGAKQSARYSKDELKSYEL